ncbi:hypothetical protein FNAPI_2788 [Fusarium napiforme]|uniref:Uncharacterized protein n=1 Tax=Fusarium napiforme TaxID=42672 RepID=A0A8H5JWK2_9HYPO|nr:hypothetical protein FNAPI_2788 [Fusarium napiforme]
MLASSFLWALGPSALVYAHGIRVERSENRLIKGPASPDGASSSSINSVWQAKLQDDGLVKLDFHRLIPRQGSSSADTDTSADATSTAAKDTSYHAQNNCIDDRCINYRRKLCVINNKYLNVDLKHSIIDKHDLNIHGTRCLMLQHNCKEQYHLRNDWNDHIDMLCGEYYLEHVFTGSYMHDTVKQRSYDLHGTSE